MREIKFRGYDKFDKRWVYGYGLHQSIFIDGSSNAYVTAGIREVFIVDKESAGQYTGCKDANGKEIYEGDIVKVTDLMPCEKYYGKTYICKIVYDKDRFIIENYLGSGSNRIAEKESFNFKSIEVIGNVFENEELLEVKSYERD